VIFKVGGGIEIVIGALIGCPQSGSWRGPYFHCFPFLHFPLLYFFFFLPSQSHSANPAQDLGERCFLVTNFGRFLLCGPKCPRETRTLALLSALRSQVNLGCGNILFLSYRTDSMDSRTI